MRNFTIAENNAMKSPLIRTVAVLLLFALLSLPGCAIAKKHMENEQSAHVAETTVDVRRVIASPVLRLRAEASDDAEILVEMPYGSQVELLEVAGDWAKVYFNGQTGFCLVKYLSGVSGEEASYENTENTPYVPERAEEPAQNPKPVVDDSWKKAYLEFLNTPQKWSIGHNKDSYSFHLIYVDDDEIPELYLEGLYWSPCQLIFSYDPATGNIETDSEMGQDMLYIPRSGLIYMTGGHQGSMSYRVDRVQNGHLTSVFHGETEEGDMDFSHPIEYYVNGTQVDEATFNAAHEQAFDKSKGVSVSYKNQGMSYEELVVALS